jgi:hypothetical protein
MSAHAVLADGASHDEVLAAVQQRVTTDFKIAHATVQVERKGGRCGRDMGVLLPVLDAARRGGIKLGFRVVVG